MADPRPPLPPEWEHVRSTAEARGYARAIAERERPCMNCGRPRARLGDAQCDYCRAIADVCAWLRADGDGDGRRICMFDTDEIARQIEARFGARKEAGKMIKIVKLVRTCDACPSQWDGWDADGRYFYFRYRHGRLRVDVTEGGVGYVDVETVFSKDVGGTFDGCMMLGELRVHLAHLFELPDHDEKDAAG